MRTVLGLSKTSTSIAWVLLDATDVSATPLDHDAFDITDSSIAAPAAIACRVRDIATTTGYTVDSVHVTTSGNSSALREALTACGFTEVVSISLAAASRTWAMAAGHADHRDNTAVCLLGRDSASLSVIDTRSGAAQTTTTTVSRGGWNLIDWLNITFCEHGANPDALYLIGSPCRLDAIAKPLGAELSIPVIADHEAQLALAKGAAYSTLRCVIPDASRRSGLLTAAKALGVVAVVVVASLFALSAATSPVHQADRNSHPASAPAAPKAAEIPADAASAVPVPAPVDDPVRVSPESRPPAAATYAVAPETVPAAPQAVQHMPATGPVAPGPVPPPPEAVPPPPQDPMPEVSDPLAGSAP